MMISNFNPDLGLAQSKDFSGTSENEQPDAEFASLLAGFCGAALPTQQAQQFEQTPPDKTNETAAQTIDNVNVENVNLETALPANFIQQQLLLNLPTTEVSVSIKPLSTEVENKQANNEQANNFDLPLLQSNFALPKTQNLTASVASKLQNSELQNPDSTVSPNQIQATAFSNDRIELNSSNPAADSFKNFVVSAPTVPETKAVALPPDATLVNDNRPVGNDNDLQQTESLEILESTAVKTIDSSAFQTFKTNLSNYTSTVNFEISRFKPINLSLKNTFAADENLENSERLEAEVPDAASPSDILGEASINENFSDIKIQQLAPADVVLDAAISQSKFNFDKQSIDKTETSIENAKNVFGEVLSSQQKIVEKTSVKPIETPILHAQLENPLVELAAKVEHLREPQTVKLRLRPEELGTVEIKIERAATGELKAHLQTETETARQIISENLSHLRDALQQSGFKVDRLDVSCNAFTNSNLGNNSGQTTQDQKFENYINGSIDVDSSHDETNASLIDPNRLLSVRA